jgi:hypothetical protein
MPPPRKRTKGSSEDLRLVKPDLLHGDIDLALSMQPGSHFQSCFFVRCPRDFYTGFFSGSKFRLLSVDGVPDSRITTLNLPSQH